MCGIIAGIAKRNIAKILIEGLRRLEYRGYDSAGLAVVDKGGKITRLLRLGKVENLIKAVEETSVIGEIGVGHTRWATHGDVSEANAHPHVSGQIIIVHNGVIENHEILRAMLIEKGYVFISKTDSEIIAHLVNWEKKKGGTLREVVQRVVKMLDGTYGMVVLDTQNQNILIGACFGNSLIIGRGLNENFIASDQFALLPVASRFVFLENGSIAEISSYEIKVFDIFGKKINFFEKEANVEYFSGEKGSYRHYMQKEIHEQPMAIRRALVGRLTDLQVELNEFGIHGDKLLQKVEHIKIIGCGTSYNSGMVSRYWFESLANISCDVEIASEFRYRDPVVHKNTLFVTISQSGETADTLAALRISKKLGYLSSLTICNVLGSTLTRESDFFLITKAGIEIGVASTKSFTTQLVVLLMLAIKLGRLNGINKRIEEDIVRALNTLPEYIEKLLLDKENVIQSLAKDFYNKQHAFFLGRGPFYPIAMEGALKLKEISYIHAEAYAAAELKHGPLALVDSDMPVIVLAPKTIVLNKLKINIEEVRVRGGLLYIFSNEEACINISDKMKIILLPKIKEEVAPIFYSVPLQLLAYHVALIKNSDVDRPRNLAKSVTVE